jgi:hypothetical protein
VRFAVTPRIGIINPSRCAWRVPPPFPLAGDCGTAGWCGLSPSRCAWPGPPFPGAWWLPGGRYRSAPVAAHRVFLLLVVVAESELVLRLSPSRCAWRAPPACRVSWLAGVGVSPSRCAWPGPPFPGAWWLPGGRYRSAPVAAHRVFLLLVVVAESELVLRLSPSRCAWRAPPSGGGCGQWVGGVGLAPVAAHVCSFSLVVLAAGWLVWGQPQSLRMACSSWLS